MWVMWPVVVLVDLPAEKFMYLHRTTNLMLRILFKVYFLLNAEVLQGNTAVFSILHSLIRLIISARNFHGTKSQELN